MHNQNLFYSLCTSLNVHYIERCSKYKSKVVLLRHEGERYSSYSFLTSVLDGVSGQRHAPAAIYPRERNTGTHWRLGGHRSGSGHSG
jgi:hypothetical protein